MSSINDSLAIISSQSSQNVYIIVKTSNRNSVNLPINLVGFGLISIEKAKLIQRFEAENNTVELYNFETEELENLTVKFSIIHNAQEIDVLMKHFKAFEYSPNLIEKILTKIGYTELEVKLENLLDDTQFEDIQEFGSEILWNLQDQIDEKTYEEDRFQTMQTSYTDIHYSNEMRKLSASALTDYLLKDIVSIVDSYLQCLAYTEEITDNGLIRRAHHIPLSEGNLTAESTSTITTESE